MRREEAAALGVVGGLVTRHQHVQEAVHAGGRVADRVGERDALLVALHLVAAAEARVHDLVGLVGELVHDGARHLLVGAHLHELALLDGADGVFLGDVDDLVAQHAGKFGFVLEAGEGPLRDVHETARGGERVYRVDVEHDELPGQVGPAAGLCERRADERHIPMHGLVLRHAVAGADALADLAAELGLFGLGHLDVLELLGALEGAAELAELFRRSHGRHGQRGAQGESDQCSSIHADSPSSVRGPPPILSDRDPRRCTPREVPPLTIA